MPMNISLFIETFTKFWAAFQHGNILPLGNWNYFFLFFFVIIQGPLVKLLSGAAVSTTYLNFYAVILVSICASLSADIGWYYLGRLGKFPRLFRRNAVQRKKTIDTLQNAMHKHYFKVLLLGKLSLGLAIPSILAAGISKVSWRKWVPVVLLGEVLYTVMLVLIGFYAAESISHANQTIKLIGLILTGIFLLILVIYLPYTIRKTLVDDHSEIDRLSRHNQNSPKRL
jgi:membrane protein DedA with SNARE-associated domain